MCQEIGHVFGLDHQDEVFDNPTFDITATIEIKITRPELSFCGKSGCPVGVIVSGEDNCKFSP